MKELFILGGSPCSGKSTIAERLSEQFGFHYFKVDDILDECTNRGAADGKVICIRQKEMTPEEIWMRTPKEQEQCELEFYRETFPYVLEQIKQFEEKEVVITEGAAYLPELVHKMGVDACHYINITPSREFQYKYYKQRPWVPYVLEGCSDKAEAFQNWMERDVLFAETVREQSETLGYPTILVDGTSSVEENYQIVCRQFKLGKMNQ